MKVLVVDDYDSTRSLLRRILVRDHDCTVVEAANGVEALAAIAAEPFTFVILDVQMPVMDGIETLRAIRESSEQPELPVVVLTAEREEATVRRIAAIGVADYLTKPLKADHIAARLARVVDSVSRRSRRTAGGPALDLERTDGAILAEGEPAFRQFVETRLAPYCAVTAAPSGAQAMKLALAAPPKIVFLGAGLGAFDRRLFVGKVRELPALRATWLVALVPAGEVDAARASGDFDAVLPRTYVADAFEAQLRRVIRPTGGLRQLMAAHPALRLDVVTAVEQAFGAAIPGGVSVLPSTPGGAPGQGITASVRLPVEGQTITVILTVRAGLDAARALATGSAVAQDAADVGEAVADLQTLARTLAGRLEDLLGQGGVRATASAPVAEVGPLPPAVADSADTIAVRVAPAARDVSFRVTVGTEFSPAAAPASTREPAA